MRHVWGKGFEVVHCITPGVMVSILQRVGALNQKAYTFSFGASAAASDNAGPVRMPIGRPMVEFSKSFLGSSGFFLVTPEQLQTSSGSKVPTFSVRATARDLIPHTQSGESSNGPPPYRELEMKQCSECKHNKPLVDFEKAGKGLRKACRACVAVTRAERNGKDMAHMSLSVNEAWKRAKTCARCGLVKEIRECCNPSCLCTGQRTLILFSKKSITSTQRQLVLSGKTQDIRVPDNAADMV